MHDQETTLLYEAVAGEAVRKSYPEAFPALPDLPTARYVDPHFYDLEMQHVWKKSWLTAGHVSELPKAGSYKLFDQLGLSIIISRGADDTIRAFHNICRHRGSALLLEPTGTARRFVCPYHAWGYNAEGALTSVPEAHNFACLDKSEKGLIPVRCETMKGLIFINLDNEAKPLAEAMAPVARQIGAFPIENMAAKGTIRVEIACNWKAAYDNFLEIYHLATVHAKSLMPYLEPSSFSVSLFEGGHSRFATRKKKGATIFNTDLPVPHAAPQFKDHTIGLPTFPNIFTALDPVGFTFQSFWPAGPNKMVMDAMMMGWPDDSEQDALYWADMRTNIESILAEDLLLFPGIQRSIESGMLPAMTMSYQERAIYWYHEEIDRMIGAENIPEALRVVPVLADHISR
ncbi:MAG: (2Fe-2S)-binding protein [Sphingomonas bacterium]|nr:(2Fe-2S)-binding protein [Sphingomonas bacterium]